jgi:hypothetical protein
MPIHAVYAGGWRTFGRPGGTGRTRSASEIDDFVDEVRQLRD